MLRLEQHIFWHCNDHWLVFVAIQLKLPLQASLAEPREFRPSFHGSLIRNQKQNHSNCKRTKALIKLCTNKNFSDWSFFTFLLIEFFSEMTGTEPQWIGKSINVCLLLLLFSYWFYDRDPVISIRIVNGYFIYRM